MNDEIAEWRKQGGPAVEEVSRKWARYINQTPLTAKRLPEFPSMGSNFPDWP